MGLKLLNAQGNYIVTTDSAPYPIESMSLYGKSSQEKSTGKNLLEVIPNVSEDHGVTFTHNADGSIIVNGTAVDNNAACIVSGINQISEHLETGKKYIVSGCPHNENDKTYRLQFFNYDGNNNTVRDFGSGAEFEFSNTTGNYNIAILIPIGTTVNNLVFKPMLRSADIADDTFEPYTGGKPSPNPEYDQPIKSVGDDGNVAVDVLGANLLPLIRDEYVGVNIRGVTATIKDGYVVLNGTTTEISDMVDWYMVGDYTVYEKFNLPSGTYVLSSSEPLPIDVHVYIVRETNKQIVVNLNNTVTVSVFDFDENEKYRIFYRVHGKQTVNNLAIKIMLNAGSESLPWEPYTKQSLTLSTTNGLLGIPVTSGGNYTDSDGQQYIVDEIRLNADGTGKWVHRCGEEVFDGSGDEGWSLVTANGGSQFAITISSNGSRKFMCTHFRESGVSNWVDLPDLTYMAHPTIFESVRFRYDAIATVDEWRANLQYNPITVIYQLAEPYETDLSAEEIQAFLNLRMNKPYTTILNDEDCFMGVGYVGNTIFWTAPKTNWQSDDRFNIADYNRIKWNLEYLHKKASELYRYFDLQYMGDDIYLGDKNAYTTRWDVADFNAFEQNLENINKNIFTKDYGIAQRFYANAPFIKWDELNRIESATLNMKKILVNLEAGLPRLAFRLGANKEVKV